MLKLATDIGGSCSRLRWNADSIKEFESQCREIPVDMPHKGDYISDKLSDFIIRKSNNKRLENRRFVRNMTMGQFTGDFLKCSNEINKTKQDITYINELYGMAAYLVENKLSSETFELFIVIPAKEYFSTSKESSVDMFKEGIEGTHVIEFPMLGKQVTILVPRDKIKVAAEGYVAASTFRKTPQFRNSSTVLVDVGYRSTEIIIFVNMVPQGNSSISVPIGGTTLESTLKALLNDRDINISDASISDALSKTYVVKGDTMYDISRHVRAALIKSPDDINKAIVSGVNGDKKLEITITEDDVITARKCHYIFKNGVPFEVTDLVVEAKKSLAEDIYRAITASVNSDKSVQIGDIGGILCIGRPFTGDPQSEDSLDNMIVKKFPVPIAILKSVDPGHANIVGLADACGIR